MNPFDAILQRAKNDPRHIVLAEGEDSRVIDGALSAIDAGIARVTLLGRETVILESLKKRGAHDLPVGIVDPTTSPLKEPFAEELEKLRRHKGVDLAKARKILEDPLYFAAVMVRLGEAEGSIGGAVATTGDTVRAAIQVMGIDPRYRLISSYFLMLLGAPHHHDLADAMVFADCALVVDPDAEALAQIALASADSAASMAGLNPRIAMLSFSTSGSASHPLVDKVIEATRLARKERPDLAIEGDVQLDAALVPAISARKVKDSAIDGRANVLIFPSLEAANIGYKIGERLGGARAIGPVLQGLARPANDLSRGCSADDVFRLIAITSVQAQAIDEV
ncbi:MAG: phosphate acetyltransferase [Geminicoccaceae bacterium]